MTIEENDLQQTGQSSFDRRVIQIKPLSINIEEKRSYLGWFLVDHFF
jgi:hypothetical protein